MARHWRIAANFHKIGDVVVLVQGPNWQSALRKAALAIKALPVMKGKKLTMGSFTLQEVVVSFDRGGGSSSQLPLQAAVEEAETQPAIASEPKE